MPYAEEDKRSEEQKTVDAIRELEDLLGWEHQYPLQRDYVLESLIPAAQHLDNSEEKTGWWGVGKLIPLMREAYNGADTCLFDEGVSTRYMRDRPCEREIIVSRRQYHAALPSDQFPYHTPCMMIPDNSDRIEYVYVQGGDQYPDVEIVPLYRVREGGTPAYLAEWGMTFRWVD